MPAILVGLTTTDTLVTFDSSDPGAVTSTVAIVGLFPAIETVVGIDYADNGQLYGVVNSSVNNADRLVTIDPATGAATAAGNLGVNLNGTSFGVSYDPVAAVLRVTSDAGQSLSVSTATGAATANTTPFYDPTNDPDNGFTNPGFFDTNADNDFDPTTNPPALPATVQLAGLAATTNLDAGTNTTVSTLYGIDYAQDLLVRIGGPDGTPSPNAGQVVVVDNVREGFATIDFGPDVGFDIEPATDTAYVANGSTVYSLMLDGSATTLGTVGGGVALTGLTVAPAVAAASTVQLTSDALAFPADRRPLAVTITRTGGTADAATVDYATADGTAVAGVDYLPASGTVTFRPGETSQTIYLMLPASTPVAGTPEKTFTLTLSNATGTGVTLGGTTAATVTIPAVSTSTTPPAGQTPAPAPFRFFAVSGGGQVAVYDAISGTEAFTFTPFAGFTGGLSVAVGDVDRDGFDDVIVGAGSGGAPRVMVYSGGSRTVLADFFAYEDTFRGGVNVAAGDVSGDGFADLVIGSGNGGGPRVRVVSGGDLTGSNQTILADFFAYEDTFRGGVNVAAGEFTGDAHADIIAGAGNTGAPRVVVFDGQSLAPVASFFAYDSSFRGGVFVAAGDVDGTGGPDLITGTGPNGGPNVRVFNAQTRAQTASFFAYGADFTGGVRVAAVDLGADGTTDILTGAGEGGSAAVRRFTGTGTSAGADLQAPNGGGIGGVFVG